MDNEKKEASKNASTNETQKKAQEVENLSNENLTNENQEKSKAGTSKKNASKTDDTDASGAGIETATEPTRRVRAMEDHQTHIGGQNVYLQKGKEYTLPLGIATILQNANVVLFK